jgi:hypothetical protein
MDTQTFDQLTRLFGTAGSRRTACRALLAGVLLGGATRGAVAASCRNGKPACGTACCPGKCFGNACGNAFCCSGSDPVTGLPLIICGNACCQDHGRGDPCASCTVPSWPTSCGGPSPGAITGSYRRR